MHLYKAKSKERLKQRRDLFNDIPSGTLYEAGIPPHVIIHRTPCSVLMKEGSLFNNALNAYGKGKDLSDSERGNPLPPLQVLLSPIDSKASFICTVWNEK